MKIDDSSFIHKADSEGMLEDLATFPEQCREAIEIGRDHDLPIRDIDDRQVYVVGMGGSAIIGDLLNRLVDIPVRVTRNYTLPASAQPGDLLIAVSYSGNTEETLSGLRDGVNRGLTVLCLSTGGKMQQYCTTQNIQFVSIPAGHQPRASTGYMLFPLLQMFKEAGITGPVNFDQVIDKFEALSDEWRAETQLASNKAKNLANTLKGRLPLIYGTADNTEVVAYRWKTQINENAKQPATWNVFPELNHNETVGYELMTKIAQNSTVVLLKNGLEHNRNSLRMDIIEEIFEEENVDFETVSAPQGDKYTKILGQMYLGDFVSTYLALLNKVDPSSVKLIESFKQKMKEQG